MFTKTFITQKFDLKKMTLTALAAFALASSSAVNVRADDDDDDDRSEKRAERLRERNERLRQRNEELRNRNNNPYYGGYYGDDFYYGNNDTRDFRDYNRNGIDDRYETNNRGTFTTITGVVTRDLSGRRFEIRSGGRTFVVLARNNEPLRLTRGDEVRISGRVFYNVRTRNRGNGNNRNNRWNANNFILADRIRITRNDDRNEDGSRVNFIARVLDIRGDRELQVRADNGRTYTVRTDDRLNSRIDEGDRVRINGRLQNGRIEANRVELTDERNDDWNNGGWNEENIDFRGRIESVSNFFGQRTLVVRADNGRTYRVRFNEDTRFREGERIYVRGDLRNGIVYAEDIDRD